MPFFLSVRIACAERVIVTFWPSTMKVFFWRLGLKTRLVRRKEKLTLWPNCLPLPVSSQRAAIALLLKVIKQTRMIVAKNNIYVKGWVRYNKAHAIRHRLYHHRPGRHPDFDDTS